MRTIRDKIIEDEDELVDQKGKKVAFERMRGRNISIRVNSRCYNMTTSVQRQRSYLFTSSRNVAFNIAQSDSDLNELQFMIEFNSVS